EHRFPVLRELRAVSVESGYVRPEDGVERFPATGTEGIPHEAVSLGGAGARFEENAVDSQHRFRMVGVGFHRLLEQVVKFNALIRAIQTFAEKLLNVHLISPPCTLTDGCHVNYVFKP